MNNTVGSIKHTSDPIYSRIDRVLANTDWFLAHTDTTLQILPPSIFDHAMLHLYARDDKRKGMKKFKFSNCITDFPGYANMVQRS